MKIKLLICSLLSLLLLPACGRRISVTNNTFADYQAIPAGFAMGSAFFVEPLNHKNKLFAKEIQHKIGTLLREAGFIVTAAQHADYSISCTIDMVSSTITVQVPRYIPGEKITTQGCVHTNDDDDQIYTETKETAGTVIYTPEERTVFKHKLQMNVYQASNESEQKKELVWQATANTSGDDNDQRDLIDYLLVSVFKYFGKNTKKSVNTDVSERSKEIKKLKK